MTATLRGIEALVFDVFGTVVDWYGTLQREGAALNARLSLAIDWHDFALRWRAGYPKAMDEVRRGAVPWASIDVLHRRILDALLAERGIALPEDERVRLNRVWHRLDPWPDAVLGLHALKAIAPIATLSNGNVSLLVELARHGGLPWDAVFSAELFGHYKPDREVYLGAARLLDVAPGALLMVAAHPSDLRAAAACGLRTALVVRPLEKGPGGELEPWREGEFDLVVSDFVGLAQRLAPAPD